MASSTLNAQITATSTLTQAHLEPVDILGDIRQTAPSAVQAAQGGEPLGMEFEDSSTMTYEDDTTMLYEV